MRFWRWLTSKFVMRGPDSWDEHPDVQARRERMELERLELERAAHDEPKAS